MRSSDNADPNSITGESAKSGKVQRFLLLGYRLRICCLFIVLALAVVVFVWMLNASPGRDESMEYMELTKTKMIARVCNDYRRDYDEWPPDLNALFRPNKIDGNPYVDRGIFDLQAGHHFRYDVKGPHHGGLRPDISIEFPGGEVGDWMER